MNSSKQLYPQGYASSTNRIYTYGTLPILTLFRRLHLFNMRRYLHNSLILTLPTTATRILRWIIGFRITVRIGILIHTTHQHQLYKKPPFILFSNNVEMSKSLTHPIHICFVLLCDRVQTIQFLHYTSNSILIHHFASLSSLLRLTTHHTHSQNKGSVKVLHCRLVHSRVTISNSSSLLYTSHWQSTRYIPSSSQYTVKDCVFTTAFVWLDKKPKESESWEEHVDGSMGRSIVQRCMNVNDECVWVRTSGIRVWSVWVKEVK